jgi:transposase
MIPQDFSFFGIRRCRERAIGSNRSFGDSSREGVASLTSACFQPASFAYLPNHLNLLAAANGDTKRTPAGTSAKPRKKARRDIGALPKHLPRCEEVLAPETTTCSYCPDVLHKIGEDVSEVLDVIPAILRVLRTVRPKYACRACTDRVVQAKVLPRLTANGMAPTALVSFVVVSRSAWYLPLYRWCTS